MANFKLEFFNQRLSEGYKLRKITMGNYEASSLKEAISLAKKDFPLNGEKTWVDEPDTLCLVKKKLYGDTLYIADMNGNKM